MYVNTCVYFELAKFPRVNPALFEEYYKWFSVRYHVKGEKILIHVTYIREPTAFLLCYDLKPTNNHQPIIKYDYVSSHLKRPISSETSIVYYNSSYH